MSSHPALPDLSHPRIVVLLAVTAEYQLHHRVTVKRVAELAGVVPSTAHSHLRHLKALGLVTWDRRVAGSLRPLVRVVAAG